MSFSEKSVLHRIGPNRCWSNIDFAAADDDDEYGDDEDDNYADYEGADVSTALPWKETARTEMSFGCWRVSRSH